MSGIVAASRAMPGYQHAGIASPAPPIRASAEGIDGGLTERRRSQLSASTGVGPAGHATAQRWDCPVLAQPARFLDHRDGQLAGTVARLVPRRTGTRSPVRRSGACLRKPSRLRTLEFRQACCGRRQPPVRHRNARHRRSTDVVVRDQECLTGASTRSGAGRAAGPAGSGLDSQQRQTFALPSEVIYGVRAIRRDDSTTRSDE
jgi:hypothetical protein